MTHQTARLTLRPPRLADTAKLFAFLGDAAAMRYTTVQKSVRDCRRYLAAHERQRRRIGCAPWVVSEKGSGAIIGFGGLYDDPFDPGWGVEVGYFFAPSAWGNGFATELTQACVDFARENTRWTVLTAFAHPQNVGSHKVLLKAGFRQERFVPEMERYLYRRELRKT
ncbi:GNAT family N-acetyltransferase [Bradyrhizobium liaoningense]|uniref:GNAT family N-acetyltransferase n=1 Tax=Bradyrhizobium liaoningense TaxID=43992 RepID=UPI001BAC5076|nr:GNAT family N-acetyltransferase [Bradyrhizobium liaoningense]MBR0718555.1 GNAT family N-acetyltransferase [Bradyrhizobium liaoningense]